MATNGGSTETALVTAANAAGTKFTVTAPTATHPNYVSYTLRGWYDIYNSTYYQVGDTVSVTGHTVLYADWIATTYDIGQDVNTVETISTSGFVTTKVFDFNELFNLYSIQLEDSVYMSASGYGGTFYTALSAGSHSEVFVNSLDSATALTNSIAGGDWNLNFLFFRSESTRLYYDSTDTTKYVNLNNPLVDYPANRTSRNANNSAGTNQGILGELGTKSDTVSLLTTLFGTDNTVDTASDVNSSEVVYGKTYVGTGDYLFQYNSNTGYYYYDSASNAASYNQSAERFYVYDYTYGTGSSGSADDFLPFNYASVGSNSNYVNYWFGMETEISFYLPDDVGETDSGGTVTANLDANNNQMVFKFSGDDDVWVFVDGELVLDLGGVHDIVYGEINFSTGEVLVVNDTDSIVSAANSSNGIISHVSGSETLQNTTTVKTLQSGTHTLTLYYLERGSGQSNAAIYYNISPVYSLQLAKLISNGTTTTATTEGVEFAVYASSDFSDNSYLGTVKTDSKGVIILNALRPLTTYYLVETEAPEGYPLSSKYLTVMSDTLGNVTVNVYTKDDELLETLYCDISENAIDSSGTGVEDETSIFEMDSDVDLKARVSADSDSRYLNRYLSIYGASNEIYGSYFVITLSYANYLEYELPATGSVGTFPFQCTGSVLITTAVFGLLMLAFYKLGRRLSPRSNEYKSGSNGNAAIVGRHFARIRAHSKEWNILHSHARDRPLKE